MQTIHVQNPGSNSTLTIGESPTPKLEADELLVKIKAAAINRADLLQRAGNYPVPEGASNILGLEMAGEVVAIGEDVTRWKKGDRVFALLDGGGYAEYCTVHEDRAMPMPAHLSFVDAAAIPETFFTAFQALHLLGKLQKDETVLIHAAGSGVGTSAIQLAHQLFEAQIIATAGQPRKLEKARELGANFAYNYKTQNFADEIKDELGEQAIDLIVDFIGEPYWEKNVDVLAVDGRMVYLAFLGGAQLENISVAPILYKRLSIMGSTLRSRSQRYKANLTHDFAENTLSLFEDQTLHPVIDSTFDWKNVEAAHQRMRDDKNTGKIVLTGM